MSPALLLPGALAVLAAVVAAYLPWSRSPQVALRVLAAVAVVTAATVFAVLLSAVAGLASRFGIASSVFEWCPRLTPHHQIGVGEGLAAAVLLVVGLARAGRVMQRHRWARHGTEGRGLLVLEDDVPVAYAAPGKPGCVVVSTGLLQRLDAGQRRILFAHERAHLAQCHHRYLLAGSLAQAMLPTLSRLCAQLELAAERCADEAAVAAVGGDRRAVATTIGHAALVTTAFASTVPGFGGSTVIDRVGALLHDDGGSPAANVVIGAAVAVVVSVVAASVQFHHLYALIGHVCGR